VRRTRPLAFRVAIAMAALIALGVVIVAGGVSIVGDAGDAWRDRTLSAPTAAAVQKFSRGEMPEPRELAAFVREAGQIQRSGQVAENTALVGLAAMAMVIASVIAALAAARLTRPLRAVAAAAADIAKGEFSKRVAEHSDTSEIDSLVRSFNELADALERAETHLRYQAAAVSHELRTPVTALRGYVQGLIEGVFPSDEQHLRAVLAQIESLSRIVADLELVSLAEQGAIGLERRACNLAEEAQLVINALKPQFGQEGLALEADLSPAWTNADPARVRQALLALLHNARQHAREGGVVRVETGASREGASLSVLDRGPGLPEGGQEQVFARFWRGEPSRARASGGSGLGLAVVRAIIEAHEGKAVATNRVGGGAKFQVTFPAAVSDRR
jgi:two-component system, OmpR family, sensor histidine kinase AdeS